MGRGMLLAGMLWMACAGLACGPQPADEAGAPPPPPAPTAAEARTKPVAATLPEVQSASSLIALHALRERARQADQVDQPLMQAIEDQWARLRQDRDEMALTPALALADHDFRRTGSGQFTLSLLFHVLAPMNEEFYLKLHGRVDPMHAQQLPPDQRATDHMNWNFRLTPSTAQWEPGAYVLVERQVTGPEVPYNPIMRLFTMDGGYHEVGNSVELGWVAPMNGDED